jgi:TolB protein
VRPQNPPETLEPEVEGGQRPKPSMTVRWLVTASVLLLAAAATAWTAKAFLGARVAGPTGVTSPSVANGEIWARVGGGDGPSFVYRGNSDGTGETALFNDGQTPSGPGTANPEAVGEEYDWSPDGSQVAYMDWSPSESAYEIFVMHPDGTGVSQITHDNGLDSSPSWSPDGTRIAYASDRRGGFEAGCWGTASCPSDIYVINVDGTGETRLTSGPADESRPDWSPDGTKIVFQSNRGAPQSSGIYVMDADGSYVTRLTSSPGWDIAPQWSPHGAKIAFVRYAFHVPLDVWVMNADGSDIRRLTDTGSNTNISFAWSPDGTKIAFTSPEGSQHWQVWVMNADGTDQRRITDLDNDHGDLAWRPAPLSETPSPVNPRVTATIDIIAPPGSVSSVLATVGAIWVAGHEGDGSAWVKRIDPATNQVVMTIPLEAAPGWDFGGGGMAAGAGSIWVTGAAPAPAGGSSAILERIDPATNTVVGTISLPGQDGADVTVDDSSVWVLVFDSSTSVQVLRVDPVTEEVVATITLESDYSRKIALADGAIWVEEHRSHDPAGEGDYLVKIDPATNQVVATLPGGSFGAFDPEANVIWTGTGYALARIDPHTAMFIGDSVPVGGAIRGFGLAAGEGGVWFFGYDDTVDGAPSFLEGYNPKTSEVDASVEFPNPGPIAMTLAPRSIWTVNLDGSVTRIDLG